MFFSVMGKSLTDFKGKRSVQTLCGTGREEGPGRTHCMRQQTETRPSLGHCSCTLRASEHTPTSPPKAPHSHNTTGLLSSFKPQLRYRLLSATQGIISNRSLLRSTLRASCTFITLCNNRLPHLDISTSSLDQKFQEGKDLVSACLVQREYSAMLSGPRGSAALDRKLLGPEREKNMVNYWQLTGGLVSDVLSHSRILTYCQKMSFSG